MAASNRSSLYSALILNFLFFDVTEDKISNFSITFSTPVLRNWPCSVSNDSSKKPGSLSLKPWGLSPSDFGIEAAILYRYIPIVFSVALLFISLNMSSICKSWLPKKLLSWSSYSFKLSKLTSTEKSFFDGITVSTSETSLASACFWSRAAT